MSSRPSAPDPSERTSPAACSVCNGFGVVMSPDGRTALPCGCRSGLGAAAAARVARIPDRYRGCSLANFNALTDSQKAAKAMARRYVESYPAVEAGLLVVGPVGVGKTHLVAAILAELVDRKGARGLFCDFTDLLERIQASYGAGNEQSADEILTPYRDAEVLVLDELGARRPTDFSRDVLYGLLNTRYNRRRVTLVTTNFADVPEKPGGESLEMRVGSPVRSRLAEMCQLVTVSGPDFRREVKVGRAFA